MRHIDVGGVSMSVLQMRKLRFGAIKEVAQDYPATKWQRQTEMQAFLLQVHCTFRSVSIFMDILSPWARI